MLTCLGWASAVLFVVAWIADRRRWKRRHRARAAVRRRVAAEGRVDGTRAALAVLRGAGVQVVYPDDHDSEAA